MSNPNLLTNTSLTQEILVEAQLSSGNNDYTVPTSKTWAIKSFSLVNASTSAVTVTVSVIKSGGSARVVFPAQSLGGGVGVIVDVAAVAMLPEAAVLRINASAGTSIDALLTGVVAA